MGARTLPTAEELYHAALGRPSPERERFLEDACRGDEALVREVRSLLALHSGAKRLLEEPVAEAATQPVHLEIGARLGHYQVVEKIGAGGMGEVYRARDTRLQREVALKILAEAVSRDSERVHRLEREARLLAALNHPHIEAIHGLERFEGRLALALELIPGETLAARLERGPLPIPQALALARQIALALAAAHERGILHRDLKPSNIQVTPEAQAKLLDFGLAKAAPAAPATVADSAPTSLRTKTGVVQGTAPYMSPEQARGEAVDRRTDVWSFGCVVYEMLTGLRAFPGSTVSDAIAAVLEREPDWPKLPPRTPANVRSLLRHCLRKETARRLRDLSDAAIELEDALAPPEGADIADAGPPTGRWSRGRWAGGAALLLLLGGVAGAAWTRSRDSTSTARVVRSHIDLQPERQLPASCGRTCPPVRTELALSADGRLLAWTGSSTGTYDSDGAETGSQALYLRRMDTGEVKRLPGTELANTPFFSPDGTWLGFVAYEDGAWLLRKVPVDGGLPIDLVRITEMPPGQIGGMGASWGYDGRIFYGLGGIQSIPAEGGSLTPVTTPDGNREVHHRLPFALPGGRALLFTSMPHAWGLRANVEAVSLTSGERKLLVEDAADARYLPSGHIVFLRRGTIMAAPFDVERLELTGLPVPVIKGVSQSLNGPGDNETSAAGQFAVSSTGLLAYAAGGVAVDRPQDLVLVDERGVTEPLPGFDRPLVSAQLQLSPDGDRLVFVERAASGLAWIFDLQRRTFRALTTTGIATSPAFSPDGSQVALGWSAGGPLQLWTVALGGGAMDRLTQGGQTKFSPAWSPDGRFLAFRTEADIHLYRFEDRAILPFVVAPGIQLHPEFSPDGRWLAYTSLETGESAVYVTSFPGREVTLAVSSGGGRGPLWSRDGSRIYYVGAAEDEGAWDMMAVTLENDAPLSLSRPRRLFRLPVNLRWQTLRFYGVHPDGRVLVTVRGDPVQIPPITRLELVQNWFAELERLSPTVGHTGDS